MTTTTSTFVNDIENDKVITLVCEAYKRLKRVLPKGVVTVRDGEFYHSGTHRAFQYELYMRHSIYRLYIADLLKTDTFKQQLSTMYDVTFDDVRSKKLLSISRFGHVVVFQSNGKSVNALLKNEYKKYQELIEYAFQH